MTLADVGGSSRFVLSEKEKMWLIWYVKTYCETNSQSSQKKKLHKLCHDRNEPPLKIETHSFESHHAFPSQVLPEISYTREAIPVESLASPALSEGDFSSPKSPES